MSVLHFRFLGSPDVQWQNRSLAFPSRKVLALLIYLVVEEEMHSRARLAALLWPESDSARAALRNALYQLRSTLPAEHVLHVERNALGFNVEADYTLDLETVAAATRGHPADQPPSARAAAIAAYRGHFLEGFTLADAPEFDRWVLLQQEQWQRRIDIVFDRHAQQQLNQGQIASALDTTEAWLAQNPLNETAYRRLMQLYLAQDNRSAALAVYQQCAATLQEELGVEPAPETKALATRLDDGPIITNESSVSAPDPAPPARSKFSEGPLVGRAEEFSTLVAAYHRAAQGKPQAITIIGEAGIGKTRLAAEFLGWATAQGADVLRGRSFESGRQLPYQPLVDALRPRLEAINAPEDYLSDTWLAELSRLMPELLDRYPDLTPAHLEQAAARTRLFEAITRLTLSLAARTKTDTPLLLFLDDLQWADATSLDVLQYAGRRWQESDPPLLLLMTARAEALQPLSPVHVPQLTDCVSGLAHHLPATTLSLTPLTAVDTEQFMTAFGADGMDQFVHWLFNETRGQPFYLVETLEDLRERGLLATSLDDEGKWALQTAVPTQSPTAPPSPADVPQKIGQTIVARFSRLTPSAFEFLSAGAVLAQEFTFELLCRVADLTEGTGLRALDELLHSQLLHENEATYRFTHDKIRDVAYAEAGQARRHIFHRRALTALAERDAPASQLAHHALAAGEQEAGFRYSLEAGDEALALFAARDAVAHYEQARAVSESLLVRSEQLQSVYVQLGRAYELLGDYEEALAIYDRLQMIAQERGDKPLELAALMARTTVYAAPTQHYDPEHVAVLTEQALPLARELDDHAAEAKIEWNLMLLHIFTGNMRDALEHGQASLAIARAHDLQQQLAYTLHDLYRPYLFCGHTEQAVDVLHESQALWRKLDNKAMLADSLNVLAGHDALIGEYDEALTVGAEALQLSDEIDNVWNQSFGRMQLGFIYLDRGEYSTAIEMMEKSITLGKQAGFMIPLMLNGSLLAWIYGMLGDLERGFVWAERALAQADLMHPSLRISPLAAAGYLHLQQGDMKAAETAVAEALERFSPDNNDPSLLLVPYSVASLALAQGQPAKALEQMERFLDILNQRNIRIMTALLYWLQGQAFLALERLEEAEAALARGRQIARKLKARPSLWRVLLAQAELAELKGEKERAVSLRQQAREVMQAITDQIDDPDLREKLMNSTQLHFKK